METAPMRTSRGNLLIALCNKGDDHLPLAAIQGQSVVCKSFLLEKEKVLGVP